MAPVTTRRIPISRVDVDGTTIDGTAELYVEDGDAGVRDFRDLDGHELVLPSGSHFEVPLGSVEFEDMFPEGR